jgi:hypothetical protein
MPNASDFSGRVDIAGQKSKSFVNRGNTSGLELNSRIIAGERLTIYSLIAQRDRVCMSFVEK